MKRPYLKKLLLSLSFCLTLLCYPYALAPVMSALAVHADKIMMCLSAIAYRLLTEGQQQSPNILPWYKTDNPNVVTQRTGPITITYSLQADAHKVAFNAEAGTITAAPTKIDILQPEQAEQITAHSTVTSRVASTKPKPSTAGSTFRPTIATDINTMADRAFGTHNHSAPRTIELVNAAQDTIPLHAQKDRSNTTYAATTESHSKSHQQILLESRQNSAAIDNAVHNRQGGRMSDRQRNIQALKTIRNNPRLSAQLDEQYQSFVNTVELCAFSRNKALLFANLLKLAAPENYAVLRQVPFLAQRFDRALGTLHHLCLNEDGSLRSGGIVGHEEEVARALAEFIMPLDGTASDYLQIVERLVELHVMGAQSLQQKLYHYYDQPFIGRVLDSFETEASHAPITEKFLANTFNQDMSALMRHCKAERWNHAQTIADHYQTEFDAMRASNRWDDTVQNNGIASKTLFYQMAYENGVFKKYQHHPLYQQIIQRPHHDQRASEAINQQLEKEDAIYTMLSNQLKVTHPSPLVEKLTYRLAPIYIDPVAVNVTLSCLSKDHPDQAVQDAYKVFFNEQGLCRLFAHDAEKLEGITFPECINNASHAKTRIALNTLLKIELTDSKIDLETKKQVKLALTYVHQACTDESLKDEYTTLAQAICDAIIIQESDKTILKVGDLTLLNATEAQRYTQQLIVRQVAIACEQLNKIDITADDRNRHQTYLSQVELARQASLAAPIEKQYAIFKACAKKFGEARDKILDDAAKLGAALIVVTTAEIIHNEIATPVIPTVNIVFNANGQPNDTSKQSDIPPQPTPDPEDPEKRRELPPNPKDPDPKKEIARGAALEEIFRQAYEKKKKRCSPCKQFHKKGNFDTAKKDFDSLQLNGVKDITNHEGPKYMGEMPDGRKITVRSHSSGEESWPTLEFQPKLGGDKTEFKIRYIE